MLETARAAVDGIPGWKELPFLANFTQESLVRFNQQIEDIQSKKIKVSESIEANVGEQEKKRRELQNLLKMKPIILQRNQQLMKDLEPLFKNDQESEIQVTPTAGPCPARASIGIRQGDHLRMVTIKNLNESVDVKTDFFQLLFAHNFRPCKTILCKNPGSNLQTAHLIFGDTSSALRCYNQLQGIQYFKDNFICSFKTGNETQDRQLDAAVQEMKVGSLDTVKWYSPVTEGEIHYTTEALVTVKLFCPITEAEIHQTTNLETGKPKRSAAAAASSPSTEKCKKYIIYKKRTKISA